MQIVQPGYRINNRAGVKVIFLLLQFIIAANFEYACAQSSGHQLNDSLNQASAFTGKVVDAGTGRPLAMVTVRVVGGTSGTSSLSDGSFRLWVNGHSDQVSFSLIGYQSQIVNISAHVSGNFIRLKKAVTTLKEVKISSQKQHYRNKDNPAVALIRQVIAHKPENRPAGADYLDYKQYERIIFAAYNLPGVVTKRKFFMHYRFLVDSNLIVSGEPKASIPVYFEEKLSHQYYRKTPAKHIQETEASNGINVIKFLDTAGINIYLNRLYGNEIEIYDNNIFLLNNQFLSPIADHSPDFYKFFIQDTIETKRGRQIELAFIPRNKGDMLFEGRLWITMDGHYAVTNCHLDINDQINLNFVHDFSATLEFQADSAGKYRQSKSTVSADFSVFKKQLSLFGQRTVIYSAYREHSPMPDTFYRGNTERHLPEPKHDDTTYWNTHRTDTLQAQQLDIYRRLNRLQQTPTFKVVNWIAGTFYNDYADLGKFQYGPVSAIASYNSQEGVRFQHGGRTTPKFNDRFYLDGYLAYGTGDHQFKYSASLYYSFNRLAPYKFPNDYIKVNYLRDVDLPGENLVALNTQNILNSFQTGKTDYWLYNNITDISYVKDFENHISFNAGFKNWQQQPAGTLHFILNDGTGTRVTSTTTSEIDLGFRYAPHEQIIEGATDRYTIYSKYPILNFQIGQGLSGFAGGNFRYTSYTFRTTKRFYLSQLGHADVTLLGGYLAGKVPFPLLNISPANQSLGYDPDAYNQMYYLEFVSDHYAGFNLTQNFNGFFLNKIPLIRRLKWREYLTFKALYGGLRQENNPLYSTGLYQFPVAGQGEKGTYALGSAPYMEAGFGVGNIFKVLRVNFIRRFNYLDHPGVSQYGIKLDITLDL